jgi:hypothetical protein
MSNQSQYSNEDLARAWIARYSKARSHVVMLDSAARQPQDDQQVEVETWWAFEELHRLAQDDPARAWAVILCVLQLAQQEQSALDNLAAGPLESLLARHGQDVIGWIEGEAGRNPGVKDLLLGVWGNAIDPTVWKRLESLVASDSEAS